MPSQTSPAPRPDERTMPVDSEHFAIRFLVPILTVGLTILAHLAGLALLSGLLEEQGISALCVMLPLDVLVLFGAGYGSERVLKRLLPTHRFVRLSEQGLALADERAATPQVEMIAWDRTVNVNAWRFTIRRRTRVPKGWFCMALHFLQDDTEIIVYTFMSSSDAEALASYENFTRLRPRKEIESNTDLSGVAAQRRLLKLEDARWRGGAEIAADDFRAIVAQLGEVLPGWG